MHDNVQYKVFYSPDFEGDRSAIIIKVHHNMTDGLGIATLFQCFCGKYDSSVLPAMKPIPFVK